eukprot:m.179079 g.179079  ORF g.179079 m.179079 type:complete len:171 (+) comp53415_c0_seq2:642-1154(+)
MWRSCVIASTRTIPMKSSAFATLLARRRSVTMEQCSVCCTPREGSLSLHGTSMLRHSSFFLRVQSTLSRFGDLDVRAMAPGKPVILSIPDGMGIDPTEPLTIDVAHTNYSFVVIASDGIWDFADDETVVSVIMANKDSKTEQQLAGLVLDVARANGSEDDITVIVIKISY